MQGRCFEEDRALPYAPLTDLLRRFCAGAPPTNCGAHSAERLPKLIKIFPDLSAWLPETAPASSLEPEQDKRRVFQALVQWMPRLGQQARVPLLVVFEDLHWCDDTSLAWLRYFVREMERQRVLVLLNLPRRRSVHCPERTAAALDRMPFVSEMRLSLLTRPEVDELLRASLNLSAPLRVELRDALHALTDGNPLFIEEVLKSLVNAGALYQVNGEWTRKPLSELRIPRSVQVAVQQLPPLSAAATPADTGGGGGPALRCARAASRHRVLRSELVQQIKELLAAQLVKSEDRATRRFPSGMR